LSILGLRRHRRSTWDLRPSLVTSCARPIPLGCSVHPQLLFQPRAPMILLGQNTKVHPCSTVISSFLIDAWAPRPCDNDCLACVQRQREIRFEPFCVFAGGLKVTNAGEPLKPQRQRDLSVRDSLMRSRKLAGQYPEYAPVFTGETWQESGLGGYNAYVRSSTEIPAASLQVSRTWGRSAS